MRPLLCLLALLLAACTQPAARVEPLEVSRAAYDGLSCPGLARQHEEIALEVATLSRKQDTSASADAAAMAMGLLLFPPALIGLAATPDHAPALAQAKGQQIALARQIAAQNCEAPRGTA